ncbi:MAG: alginate export family protein [Bacteroidales bacterium]
MKKLIIQILFLQFVQVLYCQSDPKSLKFDLSIRYRFEVWNGMNAKNYGNDGPDAIGRLNDKILLQRIIPGIIFNKAKINAAFHLQDSRAFGWSLRENKYPGLFKIHKAGTASPYYIMNPNEEFFEIYDLYVEYRQLFRNLSVKIGRQKIFYGDYRIFGPGEWGNTGRWTWDAIKISYKNGETSIDLFGGGTKINDPLKTTIPFTNTEFWGGGLYSHFRLAAWLNAEPFYAYKREGSADYIRTQSINRNWYGIRLVDPGNRNLIYDFTCTREFGNENGKQINAYGYFAKAGYRFGSIPAEPALSLRYSYASGGKKTDNVIHTFDPAYGAQDKFYGWMNIVTWSNLSDPEIVLELYPFKKDMWVEIKHNRFYIPSPDDAVLLGTMKLIEGSRYLGNETDIFVRYQPFRKWQFTGVTGYFSPGDLQQINNKDPKGAFYFALQVLFTLN